MSNKKTIFVTVLGGVAEVDRETVPKGVDVDSLKADKQFIRELSPAARAYARANGYIQPLDYRDRDIANVQALAGHKSIKTTQRYLGVSTELRREEVNRLTLPETAQHH